MPRTEKKDKEKEMGSSYYHCVNSQRKGGSSSDSKMAMSYYSSSVSNAVDGFVGILCTVYSDDGEGWGVGGGTGDVSPLYINLHQLAG
jgi:hypothetical protein